MNCLFKNILMDKPNHNLSKEKNRNFQPSASEFSFHNAPAKLCIFYSRYRFCKYGMNCNYLHSSPRPRYSHPRHLQYNTTYSSGNIKNKLPSKGAINNNVQYFASNSKRYTDKNNVLCKYYIQGNCHKGDSCYFSHSKNSFLTTEKILTKDINSTLHKNVNIDNITLEKDNEVPISCLKSAEAQCIQESASASTSNIKQESYLPHLKVFNVSSLTEEKVFKLRDTEIVQLKKRYPALQIIKENETFAFIFQPTDPDWPYDAKEFQLQVTFPDNYPLEVCKIKIFEGKSHIPDPILRSLNSNISDWIENCSKSNFEKGKAELVLRPFLKWFDRSVLKLYQDGLKQVLCEAASFPNDVNSSETDFTADDVSASITSDAGEDQENPSGILSDPYILEDDITDDHVVFNAMENLSLQEGISTADQSQIQIKRVDTNYARNLNLGIGQKLGVKIMFMGLELVEGVASVTCAKLALTLMCARCRTPCNVASPPNKVNKMVCSKCRRTLECSFKSSILHPFSNVLGTLTLVEAQAVDVNLVESAFIIDCLNCNKQVSTNGINYGQKQKLWCKFCNQKLLISIESCKFQTSSYEKCSVSNTAIGKKQERKKDSLIKEGTPLPELGTCKHYKKSHRWLRFPCCGRIYPCDICHDEKEIDHDMKFASRMICGYCSKEQPYSKDKPCTSCSSSMVPKASSHWEGGKGCRNRSTMCREDKQKFSGSCKTVSRKAQNIGKKKKK